MAGNVSVRFSIENQEVVRKALEMLGKDGEKAMRQLNEASQQPHRGLGFLSSILGGLKDQMTGLAFSIGPVGTAMIGLGPVGLAAAAAIGVVATALGAASERAEAFANWAKEIRQAAKTADVSVQQIATLRFFGSQAGMESEETDKFLDRLSLGIEEVRRGGGKLFEVLAGIDSQLVRNVASSRNNAEAIDLLAEAYANLETQGQRNRFVAAIGGRGSLDAGRLLGAIDENGGLRAMEEAAKAAGKAIDEQLLARLTQTKEEITAIKKATDKVYGNLFTEETLNAQKKSAEFWLIIAQAVMSIRNSDALTSANDWLFNNTGGFLGRQRRTSQDSLPPGGLPSSTDLFGRTRDLGRSDMPGEEPPPRPTAAVNLELMRRWTSVLGDAISPSEQLTLRTLELNAAQERGAINDNIRARAMGAFALAQERAAVATRTQLGIATEEQVLKQRLAELDDLQAKGFIKNAQERAAAERLVRREVQETMETLQVRNSDTPQLTRLAIEANRLTDSLDQGLSGALRGSTQSMMEMLKGTKTLGQGISDLIGRMADAITQALLMRAVVSPLANALSAGLSALLGGGGSILGPSGIGAGGSTTLFANAMGNAFSGGRLVPFATGGVLPGPMMFPMVGGNMGLAGEAGEEGLFPLRRMNNGKLGVHASGGKTEVTVVHQVINNHPAAKVTQRDEDDGRGGRKTVTVIDELVAQAIAQPNSNIMKALASRNNLVRG